MKGSQNIRFAELFADTVRVHGIEWASKHYRKNGMANWELVFWLKATLAPQLLA